MNNEEIQRAYLDIETTGLSRRRNRVTVVGVGLEKEDGLDVRQLIGDELSKVALAEVLSGAGRVYTYNGRRFDLPFIKHWTGLDIERKFHHVDLMFHCWRKNLKGGLKNVERLLGIDRELPGVDGFDAVRWWRRYVKYGDRQSLDLLLQYNAEDVQNLEKLRQSLHVS